MSLLDTFFILQSQLLNGPIKTFVILSPTLISKASLLGSHPHWLQLSEALCTVSPLCLCPWYLPCFTASPPLAHQTNSHSPFKAQSSNSVFIHEVSPRSLELVALQLKAPDPFAYSFTYCVDLNDLPEVEITSPKPRLDLQLSHSFTSPVAYSVVQINTGLCQIDGQMHL